MNYNLEKLNFCTLFDSAYLSRGLIMYESLITHLKDFRLYIFAFDDISCGILKNLDLRNVTIISLAEFETPELIKVKSKRSKAEYCWTCTPSTITYVLNKYKLDNCTYLDSDLVFYSNPAVLVDEMYGNQKNVLITEHRYSTLAKLYEEKRAGRFCVQFITFTNEANSLEVLNKWRLQCIDWCYARHEDGKFGDQKYLDNWPELYDNVHVLMNPGGGIAPWNVQQCKFFLENSVPMGKSRNDNLIFDVIFFHFQYIKFLNGNNFDLGWYMLPSSVKELFYIPYLKKLILTEAGLKKADDKYMTVMGQIRNSGMKDTLKNIFKKMTGYNIVKI